jgi:hypothetical protein
MVPFFTGQPTRAYRHWNQLESYCGRSLFCTRQTRAEQLALQAMIHRVDQLALDNNPRPLPVLIYLHGDHTGTCTAAAESLVEDLLSTSVIVYGISDGNAHLLPSAPKPDGPTSVIS